VGKLPLSLAPWPRPPSICISVASISVV